jgi:hypothetical protein
MKNRCCAGVKLLEELKVSDVVHILIQQVYQNQGSLFARGRILVQQVIYQNQGSVFARELNKEEYKGDE